ncbi:unnamed protein product [Sphagnum troendelagicum]|uniref:Uncharacterized protein n=1 Tax=Sphagnum troendelagicum TaxID=128251 RepID=A0ABP0TXL0_9BRYO
MAHLKKEVPDIPGASKRLAVASGNTGQKQLLATVGHVGTLEKLPVDNLSTALPLLQIDKFGACIVTDVSSTSDISSYGSALACRVQDNSTPKGSITTSSADSQLASIYSDPTTSRVSSSYSRRKLEEYTGFNFSNSTAASSLTKFAVDDPKNSIFANATSLPNSGKRAASIELDPRRPQKDAGSSIIHDHEGVDLGDLITWRYPATNHIPSNARFGSKPAASSPAALDRQELAAHHDTLEEATPRHAATRKVLNPGLDRRLQIERRKSNLKLQPVAHQAAGAPNLDPPADVQVGVEHNTSELVEDENIHDQRPSRYSYTRGRPQDPRLQAGAPETARRFLCAPRAQGSVAGDATAGGPPAAEQRRAASSGELQNAICGGTRSNVETASKTSLLQLEALLQRRMDERRMIQDAVAAQAATTSAQLPMYHGASLGISSPYVISPEDLILGSLRSYCGVVLDPQTRQYLGTAVLFVAPDTGQQRAAHFPRSGKSAWVTSIKVVHEAATASRLRSQVLICNSKSETHAAQVLLTSQAFGLAFLSVHSWPGTFGLAFLQMLGGPSSLPHRLFVDPQYGDRVYILGYEIKQESGFEANLCLRPAKVTDNSIHGDAVTIDFTSGQLGGSLTSPREFLSGLVVRADGFWTGLITCNALPHHAELADFVSAYNIYSLLGEL